LPIGEFHKPQIRELAKEAGLRVAQKKDSYEICFVPDNDYAGFLKGYRGDFKTTGEFVDTRGNVLGRHAGYEKFTIGQRKGLGITFGEPRYVVEVDPTTRQVVLGQREDLAVSEVSITGLNWLSDPPMEPLTCVTRLRYQQEPLPCRINMTDSDAATIHLDHATYGVAPGQAAVFYNGDRVLGGGWIDSAT
ncbi:MAG: tRNA 2-thiouridine(34) synthase MnmA, partial [Alphaproteobacteria bacterium]|nr:tRNA 2-thiouridine(34) synthase MnmA [Alphaproteobacteria bacterium]